MDNIKDLISRYFDGTTSIEEELELRRRLCSEELTPDVEREKELLLALLPVPCEVPQGMEERLNNFIDNLAAKEDAGKATPLPCRTKRLPAARRAGIYALTAAAAIALIFSITPGEVQTKDTFSDPAEAAIHINKAFGHLAFVMNSARTEEREVATHLQSIGTSTESCFNSLCSMTNY